MNLNQQNGWIAVSDRLPNPDTPVLAGCLNGGRFECYLCVYTCTDIDPDREDSHYYEWLECSSIVWHKTKKSATWWDTGSDIGTVTHWQPLPEPPVL